MWRIRNSATFRRLHREGRVVRYGLLEFRYLLDGESAPPRLAFVVGRRFGSAVVRNRLRRRLRAALADVAVTSPELLASGDYLVRPRPGAAAAHTDRLRRDAAAALAHIGSPS